MEMILLFSDRLCALPLPQLRGGLCSGGTVTLPSWREETERLPAPTEQGWWAAVAWKISALQEGDLDGEGSVNKGGKSSN